MAAGLVLGIGLSSALGQFLASLLFEIEAKDVGTYVARVGLLAMVGLVAVFIPAWRASQLDPLDALRGE